MRARPVALAALVVAAALSLALPAAAATPHGGGASVREAEVVIAVALAAAVPVELATSTTPPSSPAPSAEPTVDDAERLLGDTPIVTGDQGDRWDPPWLTWMATLAAGLVGLALLWWLFLEVRIQDRF